MSTSVENQSLHTALFENAPLASIVTDEEHRIIEINKKALQLFGYTKEEIINKPIKESLTQSSFDQYNFISHWLHTRQTDFKQNTDTTFYALNKGGQLLTCELKFSKIEKYTMCVFTESSRKKEDQIEKEQSFINLRESSERITRILDGVNDGFWEWQDVEKPSLIWNDRLFELLGFTPDEIKPSIDIFKELLHPDFHEPFHTKIKQIIQSGELLSIEYKLRCKNGQYKWFKARGKTYRKTKDGKTSMSGSITDIDDFVQIKEKLIAKELKLKRAIEGTNDGLWDWNILENTFWVSPRLYEILGDTPELSEIGDMNIWFSRIHPNDAKRVEKDLKMHLEYGKPFNSKYQVKKKNGDYIYLHVKGNSSKNADGQAIYMSGSLADIDTQERLRNALEISKTEISSANIRHEMALDGASVGIWEWDKHYGRKMFWSKKFFSLIGYSETEYPPSIESFDALVHPDDYKTTAQLSNEFIYNGSNFDHTYRIKTKNGYKWFRCTAVLQRNENHRAIRIVGSIQSIHEQKIAEHELTKEKRRLSIALESGKLGVWEWDVQNDVLKWDETMYDIYNVPKKETLNYDDWKKTVLPEDFEEAESTLLNSLKENKQNSMVFRIHGPNNTFKFIQEAHTPIFSEDGELIWAIGTNKDITEERESQLKLKEANKKLEQFIFTISHDLKAPLVTIKSFAELVCEAKEYNETIANWLRRIVDNSIHLEKLLDELLALARVMHQKITLEPIKVNNVFNSVLDSIAVTVEKNNAKITINDNDISINCHKKLIEQVVMNLITNAIKYKKDDVDPIITIDVQENEHECKISVSDNGKGIDPKHHSLVFKIFERIRERNDKVDGTGIGLAIVQSAIDKHEGKIWIEGNNNDGSTFIFTIPKQHLGKKLQ